MKILGEITSGRLDLFDGKLKTGYLVIIAIGSLNSL